MTFNYTYTPFYQPPTLPAAILRIPCYICYIEPKPYSCEVTPYRPHAQMIYATRDQFIKVVLRISAGILEKEKY